MKILIAAGGSGGHIFPAISLAEELEKRSNVEIIFAASKRSIDQTILKNTSFRKIFFSVNPMPYKLSIKIFPFIVKCIIDFVMTLTVLIKERPEVVVGFGGYTSGMIVFLASFCNVRTVIHEQNVVPGRANKILDRMVTSVAVTFKDSSKYFKNKNVVVTGNPLRQSLVVNNRKSSLEKLGIKNENFFCLLVIGGSQGARSLNQHVLNAVTHLDKGVVQKLYVIHIAGQHDCDFVSKTYADNNIRALTFSFMENIHDAYNVADLVISRSGSAAIFELALYSKPMILVPYPSKKNSQRLNALYFQKNNGAIAIEEDQIKGDELLNIIKRLILSDSELKKLSDGAHELAMPDADKLLANEVLRLTR